MARAFVPSRPIEICPGGSGRVLPASGPATARSPARMPRRSYYPIGLSGLSDRIVDLRLAGRFSNAHCGHFAKTFEKTRGGLLARRVPPVRRNGGAFAQR